MPLKFLELSQTKLEALPRDQTVFFFAVAPIECHGPHLPIGIDLVESARLAEMSASRLEKEQQGWTGVLMPAMPLGIDTNTRLSRITVRPHVLRDWLVDACRNLVEIGFVHFVCFSGHLGPRQLTAIEEAGVLLKRYKKRRSAAPKLVSASSALVQPKDVWKSPLLAKPDEHAGERDTSVALFIAQDLVDPLFAFLPPSEKDSARFTYWGNPAGATPERGQVILENTLDHLFPKLRAVWTGANPHMIFHTWYRIFPPNRSFFKAWLLSLILFFLTMGWIILSLNEFSRGLVD